MIFKKKEIKKEDDKLPTKFYDLIKKPIITEKGTLNVKKINIIISKGKTKRFKGKKGKRKNEKKAIISLEEGQKIDITTGI